MANFSAPLGKDREHGRKLPSKVDHEMGHISKESVRHNVLPPVPSLGTSAFFNNNGENIE